MNYFEFYQLPIQFGLEVGKIKRLYLLKSKETHPDYFTLASAKEQEEAMHQASINNEAYKALTDPNLRTQHILKLKGVIQEGEKNELTPNFLMEMMDINEQLMDAAFDPIARQKVAVEVDGLLAGLIAIENPLMQAFDESNDVSTLPKIKEIYFQRKYLLRIKEKLNTFANP